MTFDITAFRAAFPEFADATTYPDAMINFWAGLAATLVQPLPATAPSTQLLDLYVAHAITLAANNAKAVAAGGSPGIAGGITSSKSVGSVSISYDTNAGLQNGAGWFNLTVYGRQYWWLIQLFGIGCIQL